MDHKVIWMLVSIIFTLKGQEKPIQCAIPLYEVL